MRRGKKEKQETVHSRGQTGERWKAFYFGGRGDTGHHYV